MMNDETMGIKSDETLLAIIEELKRLSGANLATLDSNLDVSKSTIHRHLATLKKHDYLNQRGDTYYLGLRFLDIGGKVRRNPYYKIVQPRTKELAEETGEIAQFIVEDHGMGVFVYREWAENTVWTNARVGKRVHLHCTAAGKAILSAMPAVRVEEIVAEYGLPAYTDHTITECDELKAELEAVRQRGYAYEMGDYTDGLWAVGAPVDGPSDETLGALSVAGPTHKFKDEWFDETLPEVLLRIINEAELDITYSRRD